MTEAVLVYDDDCGFCTWWADFFAAHSDLPLVGFSELSEDEHADLLARIPEEYEDCSHLVTADRVYSCGASIEEALRRSDVGRPVKPLIDALRRAGPYNALREWGYSWAADNRSLLGRVTSKRPPARREDDRGD